MATAILTSICEECGFEAKSPLGLNAHVRYKHQGEKPFARKTSTGEAPASSSSGSAIPPGDDAGQPDTTTEDGHPGEIAPEPAVKTWKDKIWGRARSNLPTAAKRPGRPRTRKSGTDIWSMVWGVFGNGMGMIGYVPSARCMDYQSQYAGFVLDDFFAGGYLDRWLIQPVAGKRDKYEDLGMLLAPPVLAALCQRQPELTPQLEPIAVYAIRRNLAMMVPAMKRAQREEAKYREAIAELGIESGGADPAVMMWQSFFAAPDQPAPEPNNGKVAA